MSGLKEKNKTIDSNEETKTMIKKIYKKHDITVSDDYIDDAINDKERVKDFLRVYKQEEIYSMNYIFGKPYDNKFFTKFELESASMVDLFNRNVVNICKMIWDNRDNPEKLEEFMQQINMSLKKKKEA